MKRIILSTFLATLSLAATAQTGADQSQSIRIPAYTIQTPAQTYRMMPSDLAFYKGAYDLSNGETLMLTASGHQLYGAVGDRPRTELVSIGNDTFVAIDRQLQVTIEKDIHGQVGGEVLMAMPAAGVASARQDGLTPTTLASR